MSDFIVWKSLFGIFGHWKSDFCLSVCVCPHTHPIRGNLDLYAQTSYLTGANVQDLKEDY